MCEQTEVRYLDGDVVWVKLGSCWWPGRVKDVDQLPEEILVSLKKRPIAAVKFFQEDTFEYVRNLNQICLYNCRRKNEFIKKGLDIYRTRRREGSTVMDKFPDDVATAEKLTGGDPNILRDETFAPEERPNYRDIFGGDKKTGSPDKKSRNSSSIRMDWKSSPLSSSANGRRNQSPSLSVLQQPRQITPTHFTSEFKDESDHVVRIRQQPSSTPSRDDQAGTPSPQYKCHTCDFTSSRLNVIVLHNKLHTREAANSSGGASAKGGLNKSKSAESKITSKGRGKSIGSMSDRPRARSKTVPAGSETPKAEGNVERSTLKRKITDVSTGVTTKEEIILTSKTPPAKSPKASLAKSSNTPLAKSPKTPEKQPRSSEKKSSKTPVFGKRKGSKGSGERSSKKKKNDEEIREKLLADWDEEDEEQEEKELQLIKQQLSKSELVNSPATEAIQTKSAASDNVPEGKEEVAKPKETSCFDFDDSEDANLGRELEERAKKFVETRKIPRILEDKSESSKRRSLTEDIKPLAAIEKTVSSEPKKPEGPVEEKVEESTVEKTNETESGTADSEDMDEAFKNLLDETTVPSLPEVPELPTSKVNSPPPDVGSSATLPDLVLDSNNSQNVNETGETTTCLPEVTSVENSENDHDYIIKNETIETEELTIKSEEQEFKAEVVETQDENNFEPVQIVDPQPPIEDDEMELDINSMPVVMTDAIITEEPETKPQIALPLIDLIPKTEPSEPIVVNDSNTDTMSYASVKAVSATTTAPVLETTVAASKSSLVVSPQIASSSGGTVVKTPIKTVKLQTALGSVSGGTVAVSSGTLSSISKLKSTGGPTLISQKGPGGGKLVIVQAPTGQQSRYTVGKSAQQRLAATKASQQQIVQQAVGGGKVVILTKPQGQQKILTTSLSPQQQRILTTSGKLQVQPQQRLISSTGALLTQINPRSVVAKGTKLTPITQQQMKALQGKQPLTKFTMQSTQAKVILPTMQNATVAQTSPMRVIGTLKPQSNTILIQTTQGTAVTGTVVGKSVAASSAQLQAKITATQSMTRLPTSKPKILATTGVPTNIQRISVPTTMAGKMVESPQIQQKLIGIRPSVGSRMMVQKIQSPISTKSGSVGLLTNVSQVKKISGVFPRASGTQKIIATSSQTQPIQKIVSPQNVQKVITSQIKKTHQKITDIHATKRIPVVPATNIQTHTETSTTQSLQPLQPNITASTALQPTSTPLVTSHNSVSAAVIATTQVASISLPSIQPTSTSVTTASSVLMPEQIAQVVAAAPSDQLRDGNTATYVLVTIDDSTGLQSYDNSTLLACTQTSEAAARTLYIDPSTISSSGDLENIILTIDNSASAPAVLNLGQSNALSANNVASVGVENASSSVFNIGPSRVSAPLTGGSNQDILAEALANTQVFQPDNTVQDSLTVVNSSQSTVMTSRLLEPTVLATTSTLHQATMLLPSLSTVLPPPNPAGVLETSLTLNQPIMTPLEVPSTAIPTLQAPPPVPSSLELPLTITQPALSVTSQSYPSLPVTLPPQGNEDSSAHNSSLSLSISESSNVATISFNPSMPLLSEEADAQSESSVHISEQESVKPESVPSDQSENIPYNEDASTVQEAGLLTPIQNTKSQDELSYENIPENIPCKKETSPNKSPVNSSIPESYPKSLLVNSDPLKSRLPEAENQTSSHLEEKNPNNEITESLETTNNAVSTLEYDEKNIIDTDHSSSNNGISDQNSFDNPSYGHINESSSHDSSQRTPEAEPSISETFVEQKTGVNEPDYEQNSELSVSSQLNDQDFKAGEESLNASYLPDPGIASEMHAEVKTDCEKSQFPSVQDISTQNPPDNTVNLNESQHSMPLLIDEPMTEIKNEHTEATHIVQEKGFLKEADHSVNDVEMSFEQSESTNRKTGEMIGTNRSNPRIKKEKLHPQRGQYKLENCN